MVQLTIITLICAIIVVYLRVVNNELAMLATIGAGIIIVFYAIEYVSQIVDFFDKVTALTGVDNDLFKIIFKITAIGYLVEFGAGVVSDFGLKSLADKLIFVGKLTIFSVSLPILYAVFNLVVGLLQ